MSVFVLLFFNLINNLVHVIFGSSNAFYEILISLPFVITSSYNCQVK